MEPIMLITPFSVEAVIFYIYSDQSPPGLLGEINDWKCFCSLHFLNQQHFQDKNDSPVGLFLLTC